MVRIRYRGTDVRRLARRVAAGVRRETKVPALTLADSAGAARHALGHARNGKATNLGRCEADLCCEAQLPSCECVWQSGTSSTTGGGAAKYPLERMLRVPIQVSRLWCNELVKTFIGRSRVFKLRVPVGPTACARVRLGGLNGTRRDEGHTTECTRAYVPDMPGDNTARTHGNEEPRRGHQVCYERGKQGWVQGAHQSAPYLPFLRSAAPFSTVP